MTAAMAIPAAIQAASTVVSSILANRGKQETKTQKTQRKLVDQVLESLQGQGPFSDLFSHDEGAFQKSFVDPAKSIFKNQIAPQIQQSYIASGQQRGTGLDDQLLRAGVDLDQLLNQQMMHYQEGAKNRGVGAINSIFGLGSGAPEGISSGQAAKEGFAGYLSSEAYSDTISDLLKKKKEDPVSSLSVPPQAAGITRKGFAADPLITRNTALNYGIPVSGGR